MKEIKEELEKEFSKANSLPKLNDLKVKYMGKNGIIRELTKNIKNLSDLEKKDYGKSLNDLKCFFNEKKSQLPSLKQNEKNYKL